MRKGLGTYPRVIPCAIHAPGRKITQFAITCRNVPGVLARISSKMAEYGINILSGLITAEPGKETGFLTLFLDLTDSKLEAERLAEEVKALDVVSDVKIIVRRFGDVAVDGMTYTTLFLGKRVAMFDVSDVGATFNWLNETFGTGGRAILFDMGRTAGREKAKELAETCRFKGRELIEAFLAIHMAAGWFGYEIVEYNEESFRFVVRLYDNFECAPFAGRRREPMSHLIRGGLVGLFSEAYGVDFGAKETKCIAKGDEYCEFVIEPM